MKMVIFGINLPLRENYGGPQIKLNIGAQLPTCLYAVAPQHCFIAFPLSQTSSFQSVTNKKYHTFWSTLQLARDPRSLPYPSMVGIVGRVIVVIEEVRTIFDPPPRPTFFAPTSSFATRGIENLWENATTVGNAYLTQLIVSRKRPN